MKRIAACIALAAIFPASQIAFAAGPGPARSSATKIVAMNGFEYAPRNLRISKGTRVVFANRSRTAHTATDRGAFDTGRIKAGRSAAIRFQRRGTFKYHCTIHPFMRGKVVVG